MCWLAWPPLPTAPLIFIAFVPLFILQNRIQQNNESNRTFWFFAYIALLLWNALTTWWVWYASPAGAIMAIILNAGLMSLPWLFFHHTRKVYGNKLAYPAFIFYWLGFEYLHLNWDVSWPWLTLGNAFATVPDMVQWYEYTGFMGGSLWVLVVNVLIFQLFLYPTRTRAFNLGVTLLVPLFASYFVLWDMETDGSMKDRKVNTSVIQPNIDPYTEKFSGKTPEEQLEIMLQLAEQSVQPGTRLVIFPETSLTEPMDETALNQYPAIQKLRDFCRRHNGLSILTGADTYRFFKDGEKVTPTARLYQGKQHYDAYNSALLIDTTENIQVYHKSKLVPGVERLPYPQGFAPLEKLFDLGGTSGSLGIQDTAEVFTTADGIVAAPIICYESVYGDWVGAYVRNKANLLCIITNDGWWRNTPGYRQHLQYARLRAIEMRRDIARSANTGISAYIDHKGRILEQTQWWVPAQLNQTVDKHTTLTWYAQTGDYIGKISAWLAILLILSTFVKAKVKKGY